MSKQQKSIAILTCWYGQYPWYFPYFICSRAYNPKIDFYIITDIREIIPNKPENIKIIFKTFEDIKLEATKKLGFAVNIDYPYKLCEFKPAYGIIFYETIKDYDFWGSGGLDVIFGNTKEFITDEMLGIYAFVSLGHDYGNDAKG